MAHLAVAVDLSAGENVYRHGVLPSGEPVVGMREADAGVSGETAACVNCHRRSGLGTTEGQIVIPPIIGKYLFRPLEKNLKDLNLPHVLGYRVQRRPYDDVSLGRAIREGIDADGRSLNYLMPRFKLDDATLASLIAYLKDLTSAAVPGVSEDTLHFATIITPDADPMARQGMIDVLQQFFNDKNEFLRGGAKPIQSNSRAIMYRVTRRWQLHLWELTGPPDTWQAQLQSKLAAEPVFAVISGIGGKTWEPVHHFCEQAALPCLFPNVDLPVDAEQDFYSIYFSRGVLLEAQLIAHDLHLANTPPTRVIQIYRQEDVGAAAAKALATAAALTAKTNINRELPATAGAAEIAKALRDVNPHDAVVLWLRAADIRALPTSVVNAKRVYASGIMAGLETMPLAGEWRATTHITYPFDLPLSRKIRMNYPLGWFRVRHIPVVAERVQSDTYLACGILAEMLNDMLDSFVRDYLIERTEIMLSHRTITGYYPRLSLAPGQRFASKGGYLVHFTEPQGTRLTAEGAWVVP
ncbi:MAG: cytochrome C [Gammaproteobacteria bacterium]|nr:cytochrome C [Gammaproteobacteria bacterium]